VTVCSGPECGDKRNSASLHAELVRLLGERGLEAQVIVDRQPCFGRCFHGPNLYVRPFRPRPVSSLFSDTLPLPGPGAAFYVGLTVADVTQIVEEHLVAGRVVRALRYRGD
jgi:(2Fe-2S) ferredoxin